MKYNPIEIEAKWQKYWADHKTFAAQNPGGNVLDNPTFEKPKYYVLDMFPYPSGAGLHVGHPLGYIASDIVARYKRHKGFNVLHPQGYDSFGLPAEQYAIQTGQHPDKTTKENIARYRQQLDRIGFSFDWDREVRTSNADYYKHTQWIFIQLFNSWYNKKTDKAEDIAGLISEFEQFGNAKVNAVCDDNIVPFSSQEWGSFSPDEQQKILLQYRLTYLAETEVNWCPGLGTVLANDEIVNGVSERGGHQVIRKKMTQWSMRISAYAERLLQGLETIDWSESIKESQRNWIGKSVGAMVSFPILSFPKGEEKAGRENRKGYVTGGNYSHLLLEKAKGMRNNPTEVEKMLWEQLRSKNLDFKFRRQHLIDDFIVDFVCLSKKLVIEVDGEYHSTEEQQKIDDERTYVLNKAGFTVIRFTNEEVKKDIITILDKIKIQLNSQQLISTSALSPSGRAGVGIFTTRPDTIFGVTFMTLAPEHPLVLEITTAEQKLAVAAYIEKTAKRSERERMADVKTISGVFTGAYAEHPFTQEPVPIWIGDYVLAGYGTGAVMAVPCGDERDYAFANFFKGQEGMPEIKNIILPNPPKGGALQEKTLNADLSPSEVLGKAAFTEKEGFVLKNSDFLDGLNYKEATKEVISALEEIGQGSGKTNYRLRDAVFSRQRYWGEPFPVYYKNDIPYMIPVECLPIKLPEVENYLPTEDGQPPLGNAKEWYWNEETRSITATPSSEGAGGKIELNTMPGWAGSSWYWMRYMDAHNEKELASQEAIKYWESVDLYIGGSEHATGHLLYSRFWNKFLKDKGFAPTEEPFKKLINQGMILGMSAFVYRIMWSIISTNDFDNLLLPNILVTSSKRKEIDFLKLEVNEILKKIYPNRNDLIISEISFNPLHVDLSVINDITNELNIEAFKNHPLYTDYKDAEFILEDGKYIVGREVEKMSKSKYNVVSPDDICQEYGADTLRLYEMFLGPLEQSKPWNTAGISGVFGFLKKLWRLYHSGPDDSFYVADSPSSQISGSDFKSLHKTIKKVTEDIENFSFNTSVSQFMICVNELQTQNCHERAILEPLVILISPYAPHIAEELWEKLGHSESITTVDFPVCEEKYLMESEKEYPVSFNGKMRFTIKLPLDLTPTQIEEIIMTDERTITQLAGNIPKKVIIVPGKVINLVG
jgi:leucyl-tRNA synthetase